MPVKIDEWTYLGDGLYASFDGYQIVLRANDLRGGPTVYLPSDVMTALNDFVILIKKEGLTDHD